MTGVGEAVFDLANLQESATSFVTENPLLTAAIAVWTVLLLVTLYLLYRYVSRSKAERLQALFAGENRLAVLMHPNPDPDAMASALATRDIAEAVEADVDLYYSGQIRHQENRAFQTVLDLDFEKIESAVDLGTAPVVLVDHNTPRGFDGAETVEPLAVIDHHPGEGTGTGFTDVRTEAGACASIFADYFDSLDWDPVPPEDMSDLDSTAEVLEPSVSTGLMYGIQSDTSHLTKGCSTEEFEAAAYLYRGVDEDLLDRIANPEVDAEVLDVKADSIGRREVRNAFAVSDVGTITNVDAIPQAADELLRLEGVTAVVVLGDKDGTMHLSGRSRDDRVHMGKTLQAVVADVPMSGAGGHARMGGGQLSIEYLNGLGPGDGTSRDEFVDRLFDAMGGDL